HSLTIQNINRLDATFEVWVKISGLNFEYVSVPVWCEDDQNDIVWYEAEMVSPGLYKTVVDIKNHKNHTGMYYVHAYVFDAAGEPVWLDAAQLLMRGQTQTYVTDPDGSGCRRIYYKDLYAESVRFAVWSKTNGYDDLNMIDGTYAGNGVFYCDVNASQFNDNGTICYNVYADGEGVIYGAEFSIIDYVDFAIRLTQNDSVGYSQINRKLNPDVDCSSFVFYSLIYNGFAGALGSSPFYTGTMVSLLQNAGFKVYSYSGMQNLKAGDILWYRYGSAGHTEIYVGNGLTAGAHDSVVDGVDYPQGGDQTGREVSVSTFKESGWIYYLRYYD
ncbi:MAG: GBS Bsp-like repeat-containing protein, partial [Parasporobacterium sp.]|nr:GBS Bsp-like repeat-containing protein [Parasporobacterium sp.]